MADTDSDTAFALARSFIDGLCALDIELMTSGMSDDFVLRIPAAPPGVPKEIVSRDGFIAFFKEASAIWSTFALAYCDIHVAADDPNKVFLAYASDAVNVDGSPYLNTYLAMAIVENGKMISYQEMFDPAPFVDGLARLQAAAGTAG